MTWLKKPVKFQNAHAFEGLRTYISNLLRAFVGFINSLCRFNLSYLIVRLNLEIKISSESETFVRFHLDLAYASATLNLPISLRILAFIKLWLASLYKSGKACLHNNAELWPSITSIISWSGHYSILSKSMVSFTYLLVTLMHVGLLKSSRRIKVTLWHHI